MTIIEALVLVLFGIVLPTWDVGSDIALSYSFISTKQCDLTWEEYVREYRNGIEPLVVQNIGRFIFSVFNSWGTNYKFHFDFQINFAISKMKAIVLDFIVNRATYAFPGICMFVMIGPTIIVNMIIQMKIIKSVTVVS